MTPMVVGGGGFLGSHLVDRLLAEGCVTDVVDDLSSGSLANLADARAVGGALKIHTLDVCAGDLSALVGMRRPDVIYHLGLLTPAQAAADANGRAIPSLLAVLEAARSSAVGKVVIALPAGLLYGEVPTRDLPVKESRPFEPVGLRGVLARTATDLLAVYREEHAVEHTVLAMSSVYGPRQRQSDGVVAAFAQARWRGEPLEVHGDGRQTRDFLFVDDAVDALVRAGARGGGLIVNVGTGVQTSIRDLAGLVAPGASTAAGPRRRGDLTRIAVSPTRARIHLQWSPWTAVATGVGMTVAALQPAG
ncbi:MAG TPA: NAD-dependent epimerase/dehydratase family protein [Ilumatobacteraceae bacterium]